MKKKGLILAVAIVLAASVICLAGCEWFFGTSGTTEPQRYFVEVGEIDDSGVASIVANNTVGSVVRISVEYSNGQSSRSTGFFITDDGYIVTNRHCVVMFGDGNDLPSLRFPEPLKYKSLTVITADGEHYDAERIAYSDTTDIAVIKIKYSAYDALLGTTKRTFTPLIFDTENTPYYGDTLFTMGNAENLGFIFTKLMVSCPAATLEENDGFDTILLDGNINHGNSGGPLLDAYSHAVGLIYARVEGSGGDAYGIGCAISAKDVISFLDKRNIPYSIYQKEANAE